MTLEELAASAELTAAMTWWGSRLGSAGPGNGDAVHTAMMQSINERRPPIRLAQRQRFRRSLRGALLDRVANAPARAAREFDQGGLLVEIDYHPSPELVQACFAAHVDPTIGVLPVKTSMRIGAGAVVVSEGYRAPEVAIYPAVRGADDPCVTFVCEDCFTETHSYGLDELPVPSFAPVPPLCATCAHVRAIEDPAARASVRAMLQGERP